jgi:hypothetical protein
MEQPAHKRACFDHAMWRRSTVCSDGTCVEVAFSEGFVAVRDAKDPSAGMLMFDAGQWQAFLDGVRGREFDRPGASPEA